MNKFWLGEEFRDRTIWSQECPEWTESIQNQFQRVITSDLNSERAFEFWNLFHWPPHGS